MEIAKMNLVIQKKRPEHNNPMAFIISQWQFDKDRPSLIYLCIRFAIFISFFVIWLLTITMQSTRGRQTWPIYLTNWGFSLCMLQSCMSCVLLTGAVADYFMHGKYNRKYTVLRMYPVYWTLNVMATTLAFTISLIYWILIYKATGSYWSTMNFMVHGFNSILMFFDFWIVSHPVHLLHCFYPILIAMVYTTMTAIYYVCGGLTHTVKSFCMAAYLEMKRWYRGCTIYVLYIIVIVTLVFFMIMFNTRNH